MSLINVPSKKFKNAKFGATSLLTNQRARSPNFSKEQSGESVHKLFKESMGEGSTKTVQRTNEIKIFLNNKFWINVTRIHNDLIIYKNCLEHIIGPLGQKL